MLTAIISFILGVLLTIITLAIARVGDDTLEKIYLLKSLWYRYNQGENLKETIDELINNL